MRSPRTSSSSGYSRTLERSVPARQPGLAARSWLAGACICLLAVSLAASVYKGLRAGPREPHAHVHHQGGLAAASNLATPVMAAAAGAGAPAAATPAFVVSPQRPRILLFGDSLTERSFDQPSGWAACMAANYTRRADVVARGFGGYNTRWALHILPHVLAGEAAAAGGGPGASLRGQVLFMTLLFGANDAARLEGPSHSARQHVPLDEYGSNLRAMVDAVREAGVQRIVLITPPPVWEPGRKAHQIRRMGEQSRDWPLDRTNEHTERYARAAAAVSQDLGLPCLDLHTELLKEEGWGERLFCDGLHFTPAGQERVWQLLQALLAERWPDVRPEALAQHFPPWELVDPSDIAASFVAKPAAGMEA